MKNAKRVNHVAATGRNNYSKKKLRTSVYYAMILLGLTMLLGCNCHQEKNYFSVLDKACPAFEKKFPFKQAEISKEFAKDDLTWIIEYSSFEEAEWKMIHFFFPDGKPENGDEAKFDYGLIKQLVLADTSSISYSFDSIIKYANITIADSDDGLVRIYTWEEPHNSTMSNYDELTQYRWNDTVLVQGKKGNHCQYSPSLEAQDIHTLNANGTTYYLVLYHLTISVDLSFMSFNAFHLTKDGLEPVELFRTRNGLSNSISFEYNTLDWFYRVNLGEGSDWLGYYNKESNVYYHPESYYALSDRYIQYIFDGNFFAFKEGTVANPFLSASLQEYNHLVRLFETKRNKIRIDQMDDKTYRYAAWKEGDKMIDDPDMVILNGHFNNTLYCHVFMDEGYEYRVYDAGVFVFKDDTLITRLDMYNRWWDE